MTTSEADDSRLVTSGLLFETSYGSLVVDLFGCDFPSVTAQLVNLARCGFWNGAVANDVVSDAVLFFSHASDNAYDEGVGALLCVKQQQQQTEVDTSFFRLVPGAERRNAEQLNAAVTECEQFLIGRRRCVGVQDGRLVYEKEASSLPREVLQCRRGTLLAACMPPSPSNASPLRGSSVFRFGLVLSDRDLSFLKGHYVPVGAVREGHPVLDKLQRQSLALTTKKKSGLNPIVAAAPLFPRPVRMIRVHRALVLPTVGTESYTDVAASYRASPHEKVAPATGLSFTSDGNQSRRSQIFSILQSCGAFRFWASASDIAAAQTALQGLLQKREKEGGDTTALVVLSASTPSPSVHDREVSAPVAAIEYNAHFTGDYLSSDDDDFAGKDSQKRETTREAERRRQALKEMYQEKANETMRLMLNVLDGVADVHGDIKPPENVLFVCKLNPVTTSEGLALCFSQFGKVVSADIITDKQTKQSLCYGFVEFDTVDACFRAFQKMDKALLDDSRIHVDFSQSVSKLWAQKKKEMRKRPRPA